jgi:hypothetical protein
VDWLDVRTFADEAVLWAELDPFGVPEMGLGERAPERLLSQAPAMFAASRFFNARIWAYDSLGASEAKVAALTVVGET